MSRKVIGRVAGVCARTEGTAISVEAPTSSASVVTKWRRVIRGAYARRNGCGQGRTVPTSLSAASTARQLRMTVAGGAVRSTNRLTMNRPSGATSYGVANPRAPYRHSCFEQRAGSPQPKRLALRDRYRDDLALRGVVELAAVAGPDRKTSATGRDRPLQPWLRERRHVDVHDRRTRPSCRRAIGHSEKFSNSARRNATPATACAGSRPVRARRSCRAARCRSPVSGVTVSIRQQSSIGGEALRKTPSCDRRTNACPVPRDRSA